MTLTSEIKNQTIVIQMAEDLELDLYNVGGFYEIFIEHLRKHGQENTIHVILNMKNVRYMDSSAIAKFIAMHKQLTESGQKMYLIHLSLAILEVFKLTCVDRFFSIIDEAGKEKLVANSY